jgi:hypothetical protein
MELSFLPMRTIACLWPLRSALPCAWRNTSTKIASRWKNSSEGAHSSRLADTVCSVR